MPANIFLDTNIIIYGYSEDEPDKQQCAVECMQAGTPWISTQVLNETINTLRRKFKLDYAQIGAVVEELNQQLQVAIVSTATIQNAVAIWLRHLPKAIAERYQYSSEGNYRSVIESSIQCCFVILSEANAPFGRIAPMKPL
jgi:predicted nucleic acid-binding protein